MTPTKSSTRSKSGMSAICASAVRDAGAKRAKTIRATTRAEAPAVVDVAVAAAGAAGDAAADAAAAKARNGKTLPGILRERNPLPRTLMPRKNVISVNKLGI